MLPNLAFDFITDLHLFPPKYFFEWRKMIAVSQSEVHFFLRGSFSLPK